MSQRTNLSDSVLSKIESMITGKLNPGDRIPTEKELSEQFLVGRSTIRESMKALVAKGLVERTTEGTFVSESVNKCLVQPLSLLVNMEIGNVADLLELRRIFELGTIRIAAERITKPALDELRRLNWQLQEPGAQPATMQERDIEFHSVIARATGNKLLEEMLYAIRKVISKNVENLEVPAANIDDMCRRHQDLIEALEERDAEAAHAVLVDYFMCNEFIGSYTRDS